MKVPYLVVQGAHDFLGLQTAVDAYICDWLADKLGVTFAPT